MLAILSPAKSLNTEVMPNMPATTEPAFLDRTQVLADHMRHYSPAELAHLMKLSDSLSSLNAARFEQWQADHRDESLLPAVFAFNGDVYQGLDIQTLAPELLPQVNARLRILSGLYGLLRPLDAMRPYRLEMGTKLQHGPTTSLPKFWRDTVTDALNHELQGAMLVNLASQEYAEAVDFGAINGPVVSPVFKDFKNGDYKIISFYAKRARGLMARFLVEHEVATPEALQDFNYGGYQYSDTHSKPMAPCFIRDPSAT